MKKFVNKKQILALLLALAMLFTLAACGGGDKTDPGTAKDPAETKDPAATTDPGTVTDPETAEPDKQPDAEPVELIVFAAASMTAAMEGITEMYKDVAPNVTIVSTLDSSGTLKTQIQEGADCDIFISASQKSMNQLDITADPAVNTDKLDFVVDGARINLVSNFCVLAVPEGNPAGVTGFADVATDVVSLISLGNSDVPAGQYAQQIFEHLGIWDQIQDKISFASNVKEVTTQVSENAVDCGIVYGTDAIDAGLTWVEQAAEGMHSAVVYPAAVMKCSQNVEAATAFLGFLQTDEVAEYLVSLGFSIPNA